MDGPTDEGMAAALLALEERYIDDVIVATRSGGYDDPWVFGPDRNLMHHAWMLRMHDEKVKRSPSVIYFDTMVDFPGVRLSDGEAWRDNLSKKLLCLELMARGVNKKIKAASSIESVGCIFDWFVRWRRSLGVQATCELEPRHFDHYVQTLTASRDICNLVPLARRLDGLGSGFQVPLTHPSRQRHPRVDWEALSSMLGVNWRTLSRSTLLRTALRDRPHMIPDALPPGQLLRSGAMEPVREAKRRNADPPPIRSVRQIEDHLWMWRCLWTLSSRGVVVHDPLTFDPFEAVSLEKISRAQGVARSRTPTIPPPEFLRLLDAAAKWVLDYYPQIREAMTRMAGTRSRSQKAILDRSKLTPLEGMPGIELSWKSNRSCERAPGGIICLTDAIQFLVTACAILVGAFGARRKTEINSLIDGCVSEEKPGLHVLSVYIAKSLRALDGIPIPPLVRTVVATLEELTAATRRGTGNRWLFELTRDDAGKKFIGTDWSLFLRRFATINGIYGTDGEVINLKSHELRRGFATTYYHGFIASSFDALSRFLRHFDPNVTRIYIRQAVPGAILRLKEEISARQSLDRASLTAEDREWASSARNVLKKLHERAADFNNVRCEALAYRLLQIYDGSETPIGRGAVRIRADVRSLAAEAAAVVRIGSRRNDPGAAAVPLLEGCLKYARDNYLEPVPGHPAHCTFRPGNKFDMASAACLQLKRGKPGGSFPPSDEGADYAFSGTVTCAGCDLAVLFSDNMSVLHADIARSLEAAAKGATTAARRSAAEKAEDLAAAMAAAVDAVGPGGAAHGG